MKINYYRLLAASIIGLCTVVNLFAQAPATLTDFTGKLLRMTSATGNATSVGRFRANLPPQFSGNLFLIFTPSFGPTNASYSQISANQGLLRLSRFTSAIDWETNNITLNFAAATAGNYSNSFLRSGVILTQSNVGTFTLATGTNLAPEIILQTPSQIVQPGTSGRTLGINTVLGFDIAYRWRLNGANLPGATTNFILLNNIQAANLGDYTCVLSNALGVVTSAVMNVSFAKPVNITQQPQSTEVVEGSYVNLSVQTTGDIQSYSWYRAGGFLNVLTNTVSYPVVQTGHGGDYYCVIENYGVSVTSKVATVTVRKAGGNATWLGRPFVKVADDKMAVPGFANHFFTNWGVAANTPLLTFRDGKIHFVAGTSAGGRSLFRWTNGVLSTLVFTNTLNPLGGFFGDLFYPTDEGNGIVNFSANSAVNAGMFAYSAGGIANVINYNLPVPGRANFFGGPGSYGRRGNGVAIGSSIFSTPGSFSIVGAGVFFQNITTLTRIADDTTDLPGAMAGYGGRPTANSINFDGSTIVFSTIASPPLNQGGFFKATPAGAITKLADSTDPRPENPASTFSNFSDIDVDGGLIFGVANNTAYKFEADGSVTNIGSATYVSASGARQAYHGSTASLTRWFDGTNALVLSNSSTVDNKSVQQIIAADGQGDDVAVLLKFADFYEGIYLAFGAVSAQPVITGEPLDFNVVENGSASFGVSAVGQGPLSYQWRKNGAPMGNATNAVLLLNNVQASDVSDYSVVVSNSNGSVTSRVAQLTRTIPAVPIILSGPTLSGLTTFGANVTLSVVPAGAAPLTYIWRKDGAPIAGVNAASLLLTNLGTSERGNYSVTVSNANGSVTSSLFPLTAVVPLIKQHPASVTNSIGGTASFTVVAEGIPPLTYQWQKRIGTAPAANIAGATNATLTLANLSLTNAGTYRVTVASVGIGSITSNAGVLTVLSGSAPDAPRLQLPSITAGQFQFQLPTQAGFNYQIQTKTNLTGATWTTEQSITGDGTTKTVTSSGAPTEKFIRVLAQ